MSNKIKRSKIGMDRSRNGREQSEKTEIMKSHGKKLRRKEGQEATKLFAVDLPEQSLPHFRFPAILPGVLPDFLKNNFSTDVRGYLLKAEFWKNDVLVIVRRTLDPQNPSDQKEIAIIDAEISIIDHAIQQAKIFFKWEWE